jgi:hypothetical protein
MSLLDTCSLKISLPVLFALLVIAQIDLASAAGWPQSLLALLHFDGGARRLLPGSLHRARHSA